MYGEFQGADLDMRHVITEEVADSNSTAALVSRRSRDGLLEVPVTKPGTCTRPAT
jgi:hypothetical protein